MARLLKKIEKKGGKRFILILCQNFFHLMSKIKRFVKIIHIKQILLVCLRVLQENLCAFKP